MRAIYLVCIIALLSAMVTPAMAQDGGWVSDSDVVAGLDIYSGRLAPTVFNMDGTWYLISGEGYGLFHGFCWHSHRSQWISDSGIVSGLPTDVTGHDTFPEVFYMNGTWYLIAYHYPQYHGWNWTGREWQSDPAIISGLPSCCISHADPTVFNKDGTWYLVRSKYIDDFQYAFIGYTWTGSTWESDSDIVSGLDIAYHWTSTVFYKDGTWYLIAGEGDGTFRGYTWTGSAWESAPAIVSGLPDIGQQDVTPDVFYKDGTWYLISGASHGQIYGFHYQYPTTKPDLIPTSLSPTILHLDQSNTLTATIRNDGGGNASSFNVSLKLGEELIGTKTVDALNIGEETSVDFTWTPTSTRTFNLTVTADTETVIDEFDKTNNVMMVMVTVERASTPFLISGMVNYDNGDAASNLTVTVTNQGTSEEFTVKTATGSNCYCALTDSRRVSVGDTIRITTTDGINSNETSHTVTANDMNSGGFGEDLALTTTPDLTITKISLKTPGYANEENVLSVGLKNIGRADAGLFSVSLSIDGTPMGEQTVSLLAVGETAELEYIWTPAVVGEHALSATADANNEVEESDEINNDLSRTSVIIKRTDWPQFHYDEVHSGFSSSGAPDTNETLWISDDISAIGGTSTVVADGKVFAYGGLTGGDGALYCFDETTGAILWNVGIPAPAWGSWSSPAYHNGRVFTSTDIETGCYDAATGEQIWVFENPTGEPSVNGGPVVADGKVIVNDWQAGHFYCLDEETGKLLWTFTEEQTGSWGTGYAQGVPAYEDGKFYLTTWIYIGGNVYCIDADTGDEIWHQTTPLDTCGSPTVVDGTVYVTIYDFYGDGDIYAMDATNGSILWQKTIQRSDSTPAVAYGNVYVTGGTKGFSDRKTYCFNATTGNLIWSTDTADEIGAWTCSVAVADGKVFVGTEGGWFDYAGTYALDAFTGDVIWSYPEGGASPAIADGTVFTIGCGRVYAFGGSEIPAGVRIEPEILNLDASGVFTAFITLLEGYDGADIDVSTVKCEDAPALSGTIAASDSGTLVVKFDRADLVGVPAGNAVRLSVTGELTDGIRFEGSDTVRVIAKGT
ncbi:MAG: Outer membrane protein assembly factor BamB [Candidatus Argoarchaeum ethanivorans]|uniref:Outer membrane protein assembly factor BamB n=1 Tax=Candidatus Argoarchaeum ethanivorans TaxID=2608793 RepID=A0A811TAE8_9EURY|nr:MAG: Outer membrane protein assembly factor BamB [Candidatus Argoarchaeum ethanivorans]